MQSDLSLVGHHIIFPQRSLSSHSVLFSRLDWYDSGVWRCQLKTCWGCYRCWCWCWQTCWRQFDVLSNTWPWLPQPSSPPQKCAKLSMFQKFSRHACFWLNWILHVWNGFYTCSLPKITLRSIFIVTSSLPIWALYIPKVREGMRYQIRWIFGKVPKL